MTPAPTHHPAEETLLRHAAGTLSSGHSLVVATHLPFCPDCRDAVRLGEAIGGALLGSMPVSDLSPDALTRTMARLDLPAPPEVAMEEPAALDRNVRLPAALRGLTRPKWRWLAPGISRIPVSVPRASPNNRSIATGRTGPREHVWLLRVAPGKSLPDHGHRGWEATCVLSGSFTDITGAYGPGDVAETDGNLMHQPIAGPGIACVCLIAWEGNLRMRGALARLIQPLLGI